jgi:hypothetical protein
MSITINSGALLARLIVAAAASPPGAGARAPGFSLSDSNGSTVALNDYAGRSKLVLVFYRGYW